MNKNCSKCKASKDIEQFCVVRKNKDGRNTRCKKCCNNLSSEWKKANPDKNKDSQKRWTKTNRDRVVQLKKNYRERNPERARAIVRKSLKKNKEKYKPQQWRRSLERLYGINPEEFYRMQKEQNNLCAICRKPERDVRRQKLCVDHCHKTNLVRGLLCFTCNVMLGSAQDSLEILTNATKYLEKYRGLSVS